MIRGYLKIAFRNLLKNKIFSFINIFGLAIGLAACILIFMYISHESSYDNFHNDLENIYRINLKHYQEGELLDTRGKVPRPLGKVLYEDLPEVIEFARLNEEDEVIITYEEERFLEEKVYYADSTFLTILTYPLIQGDNKTVLAKPNSAVLTQRMTKKYFKDQDPVGKEILVDDGEGGITYTITGILKNIPENTHLDFDFLLSSHGLIREDEVDVAWIWNWISFFTYVKLEPQANLEELESKISQIIEKYNQNEYNEMLNIEYKYQFQNLGDIYLQSEDFIMEPDARGSVKINYYLTVVGIFILILAWFNYINLTTTKSIERSKEVGIRKVNGALRYQLILQFFFESLLLNIISIAIALTLVQVFDEYFQNFLGKSVNFLFLINSKYGVYLLIVFISGTIISGIYPAIIQTVFKPVDTLKGKLTSRTNGDRLRKSLIVLQFMISFILISGILIVNRQINFMINHDLGFDPTNIVLMHKAEVERAENFDEIEQMYFEELRKHPNISHVTFSFEPGRDYWSTLPVRKTEEPFENSKIIRRGRVDNHFFRTYGIELLAGRDFSDNIRNDTAALILNEEAVKFLGFESPRAAVEQPLSVYDFNGQVVGVVSNFNQLKLNQEIKPVVFHRGIPPGYYAIKLVSMENLQETLNFIKMNFDEYLPGNPFDYTLFSDYFNRQYKIENTFNTIILFFTVLAIIIACLGLFGLSSFEMIQRTKEIGVRKVMGATVNNILFLYALRFLKLIFLSILFALPLTYMIMNRWLENYAFRIELNIWYAIIPVLSILIISFFTISFQIIKTGNANPANSLRYE
ncbi:ABC transporter permease [Bacteroidota bacterium]